MDNQKIASDLVKLAKELISEKTGETNAKDVQKMAKGIATDGKALESNFNAVVKALKIGDEKKTADAIKNAVYGIEKLIKYLEKDMSQLKKLK